MGGSSGLGTGLGAPLHWGSEVDDIDDAFRLSILSAIMSARRSAAVLSFLLDVVPQVPLFHKALKVRLEAFALISPVPILLVISTELALVAGRGVTSHGLRPFEEGLCLYLVEELINGLFENRVYRFEGGCVVPGPPAAPRGCGRGGGVPSTI
ncbi:hypothetical protein AAC387_Pa02g0841 [Persea americana]